MPFKPLHTAAPSIESPESLFLDLRARKVLGLLAHQADVLREYVAHARDESDVAFQLPTGSGKTLVGLLIGEWRRRKFAERVVYLCPTNQLVYQVVDQARAKYGLKVNAFTGKKGDFDQRATSEYLGGDALAITSYSALFNTNPFFDDPHTILLDDAHAAESYVAAMWSFRVERHRDEHGPLYAALAGILRAALPPTDAQRLTGAGEEAWDAAWVDKIPTPTLYPLIPELVSVIDAHVGDLDLRFPWSLLRDRLHACHVYLSTRELLIRPLLPPTHTHRPFAGARQRVYMSATLGEGGELERLTGRSPIARLRLPAEWDKHSIGRRLFFFPERSLDEDQTTDLAMDLIREAGRALVLVPDDRTATRIRETIRERLGCPTFNAREIERSKSPFISEPQSVAVAANRYDGIDFPDDECRLLIVEGVPRATNLQERFLITRLSAVALLNDRILTRLQQAFGRCTRAATDYAAVVVRGEELLAYLLKRECREFLHPELQAELQYGIDQSQDVTAADFLDNLKLFLVQGPEWSAADADIVALRQGLTQRALPGTPDLRRAAPYEIAYNCALWQGNFPAALAACRQVLTELEDPDLRGYRALWNYLAGSAAWLSGCAGVSNLDRTAREYFNNAAAAAAGIRWLVGLATPPADAGSWPTPSTRETRALATVERLEVALERLGTLNDRKYAAEEAFILVGLAARDKAHFEPAHVRLGQLLGYEAGNQETRGAPDPWWLADEELCLIFEDHADADGRSPLSVTKARQASTHPNWARENLPLAADATIVPVLVTPVASAEVEALPHLRGVCLWSLDAFRGWAQDALAVVRGLRRTFPGVGDLAWKAEAAKCYIEHDLDPEGLVASLRARPADDLLRGQ